MKLRILGCGTSTGVPLPGCHCRVCLSGKDRNIRSRTSALLELPRGTNILIDATTDLRHQALRWKVERIDAVLFTHPHADHILGIDDLRCFNFVSGGSIPCYGNAYTLQVIRQAFSYVFNPEPDYQGGMLPQIDLHEIGEFDEFEVQGAKIQSFPLEHGKIKVLGFRTGDLAYATDCKRIPPESMRRLKGVRYLVLDGLRQEEHATHMTIAEAVRFSRETGAERTFLTHMTHTVDYDETSAGLPPGVELAYDGLEIAF